MSVRYRGSLKCPACGKFVSVKRDGHMYRHGPQRACTGATDYIVEPSDSPRAIATVNELRELWRAGDAVGASNLTGVPYSQPTIPSSLDVDEVLAFLVADARVYIEATAKLIGAADAMHIGVAA